MRGGRGAGARQCEGGGGAPLRRGWKGGSHSCGSSSIFVCGKGGLMECMLCHFQ